MFIINGIGRFIRSVFVFLIVVVIGATYVWNRYEDFQARHHWLAKVLPGSYQTASQEQLCPVEMPKPDVWAAQFAGQLFRDIAYAKPPTTEQLTKSIQGGMQHAGYLISVFNTAAKGGSVDVPTRPLNTTDPATGVSDTSCGTCPTDPRTPDQQTVSLKQEQFTVENRAIAAAAVAVANSRHLPEYAKVVILAAGGQESVWRNLSYGDRDSVGWLQQRAGWGTVAQRMDPTYAAGKFFDALVRVSGWQQMTVTQAAQAVQRSGYPDAYARWEVPSRQLLSLVDSSPDCTTPETPGDPGGTSTPASWDTYGNPRTVKQALAWYAQQVRVNAWIPVNTCETQVRLAYGWANGVGINNPIVHWSELPAEARHTTGEPPAGALVYWRTAIGHIAVSAGQRNGVTYVYSTDAPMNHFGLVPISRIDGWGPRIGWSPPFFPRRGSEMVSSDVPVPNLVPFPVMPAAVPDPLARWKVAA